MGDTLKSRVLLYLGLGKVWVELEALSARLKRLEGDVYGARTGQLPLPPPSPKLTIPASPPPPPDTGVHAVGDREVSDDPTLRFGRKRQGRGES